RSTTSSTPFKERWFALRVAMVSGRCASRTASRSIPGMSQSAGISSAASEVSPWSSGWFATLEGTSKTWHSCDLRLGGGGLGRPGAELDGILQQVVDGRGEPLRVADDGQRRGREVDVDGALLEYQLRANTLHRVRDDGSQVDLRHLLFHRAVLQAGQEKHPL